MSCVRVILGVSVRDRRRNTELRAGGLQRVEVILLRRRLKWLGHVARMDSTCIPKCMLVCKPEGGKRLPGGQKRRWTDAVVADLSDVSVIWIGVSRLKTGHSGMDW